MRAGRRSWVAGALALLVVVAFAPPAVAKQRRPQSKPSWAPEVRAIAKAVEDIRGHEFDYPVRVRFLDDDDFEAAAGGPIDPSIERDLHRTDRVLRVLGLLDDDDDLLTAFEDAESSGLLGWYDGRITVRGRASNVASQYVLAHELTHALHDQALGAGAYPESELAAAGITAIEEGDADRVANRWLDRQSPARRRRFDRAYERLGPTRPDPRLPEVYEAAVSAPYAFGAMFAEAVHAKGGDDLVDDYLEHPPLDDGSVLNPLRIGGEDARRVALPPLPAGARRVGPSVGVGALSLFHLLASRVDPATALAAADAWAGGRRALYRLDGEDCVRTTLRAEGAAGTDALGAALGQWVAAVGNATITTDGPRVTVDACGEPAAPPASVLRADLYALLRNEIVVHTLEDDVVGTTVACLLAEYATAPALQAAIADEDPHRDEASRVLRRGYDAYREQARAACGTDPGPLFAG